MTAMNLINTITFPHDGKEYELRLYSADNSYKVISFRNGHQVSATYSVLFEAELDQLMQHKESIIDRLFEIAKSDIKQGWCVRA